MGLFPVYRRQAAEARGEPRNANGLTPEQERFRQLRNEIANRNAPYMAIPPAVGLGLAAGVYTAPIAGRLAVVAAGRATGRLPSGFGDLTRGEVREIRRLAEAAERSVEVVGSAARGQRRGVGTRLPIGKGPGTRSDIDYTAPHSSTEFWEPYEHQLPSSNAQFGDPPINYGGTNPYQGPGIKISPQAKPQRIPRR